MEGNSFSYYQKFLHVSKSFYSYIQRCSSRVKMKEIAHLKKIWEEYLNKVEKLSWDQFKITNLLNETPKNTESYISKYIFEVEKNFSKLLQEEFVSNAKDKFPEALKHRILQEILNGASFSITSENFDIQSFADELKMSVTSVGWFKSTVPEWMNNLYHKLLKRKRFYKSGNKLQKKYKKFLHEKNNLLFVINNEEEEVTEKLYESEKIQEDKNLIFLSPGFNSPIVYKPSSQKENEKNSDFNDSFAFLLINEQIDPKFYERSFEFITPNIFYHENTNDYESDSENDHDNIDNEDDPNTGNNNIIQNVNETNEIAEKSNYLQLGSVIPDTSVTSIEDIEASYSTLFQRGDTIDDLSKTTQYFYESSEEIYSSNDRNENYCEDSLDSGIPEPTNIPKEENESNFTPVVNSLVQSQLLSLLNQSQTYNLSSRNNNNNNDNNIQKLPIDHNKDQIGSENNIQIENERINADLKFQNAFYDQNCPMNKLYYNKETNCVEEIIESSETTTSDDSQPSFVKPDMELVKCLISKNHFSTKELQKNSKRALYKAQKKLDIIEKFTYETESKCLHKNSVEIEKLISLKEKLINQAFPTSNISDDDLKKLEEKYVEMKKNSKKRIRNEIKKNWKTMQQNMKNEQVKFELEKIQLLQKINATQKDIHEIDTKTSSQNPELGQKLIKYRKIDRLAVTTLHNLSLFVNEEKKKEKHHNTFKFDEKVVLADLYSNPSHVPNQITNLMFEINQIAEML
ncbi:hypothetical protein TRFO_36632 [Tritrichomonas foetus]|uniref:Uncharacterized protein n=1 Tax=Tritrichomonas foetus TaxID=1144522 RepID=A0A1J4JIY2_9EUKA|nr:hypothetical protein TRFO_36632 [Tritrichomonas foetus]|eukprot:OHS97180.1 hypothetical protein TRFO_36632 [Tritrichomonas foetus]